MYQKECEKVNKIPFSTWKGYNYFDSDNFAIFKPKKDMCNICYGYSIGTIAEEVYEPHFRKKVEALALKEVDKREAKNKPLLSVIVCDTVALLTLPFNNSDILYYKLKLNAHNFTFLNLKIDKVDNYFWTEINSGLNASEFVFCYVMQLKKTLEELPQSKEIILWSDGCCAQNRSAALSSAILTFAVQQKVTVYQKYLEVGHTHTGADGVHAAIENAKKNRCINVPSDYQDIIINARKKKYNCNILHYSFF